MEYSENQESFCKKLTIYIKISSSRSELRFSDKSLINKVISELTIPMPNKEFAPSYRNYLSKNRNEHEKIWDGNLRYYYLSKKETMLLTVPTGLLPIVYQVLKNNKEDPIVVNSYLPWSTELSSDITLDDDLFILKGLTLRQDQTECIEKCISLGRGIIQSPTGSGKTEIMLSIIKWFCRTFQRDVLVLTNRRAIKEGTTGLEGRFKERLDISKEHNRGSGIYLLKYKTSTIMIAMVQSLANLLTSENPFRDTMVDWLSNVGLVFCDEVHGRELSKRKAGHRKVDGIANKKVDFFKYLTTYYRFGMSATPFNFDESIEDKIHKFDVMRNYGEVIKVNYKSPIKVKVNFSVINYPHAPQSYPQANDMLIESKERFYALLQNLEYTIVNNRIPLIFVDRIEHGQSLEKDLKYAGLKVKFLYSKTSRVNREEAIKQFLDRRLDALIVSSIFYYGINIPRIDAIILFYIGKDYIELLQAIGRGMREVEGKKDLLVFDFLDNDGSYLQQHAKVRKFYYEQEGYEIANE